MKKMIAALSSLLLIGSSSTIVTGCTIRLPWYEHVYDRCFDENLNNVTDQDSDQNQWIDIGLMGSSFFSLDKNIFSTSESFYQNLNDRTSSELIEHYLKSPSGEAWKRNFEYNFTFLITGYDAINKNVIAQMQENDLKDRDPGIYLFLNLPKINIENIQNELKINFQLIFLTKNEDGTIIGNNNNNWFYWMDFSTFNIQSEDNGYFFNLDAVSAYYRVVTKYYEYN